MFLPESDVYPLYLASLVGRLAVWWAAGSRSAPAPMTPHREGLVLHCCYPPFYACNSTPLLIEKLHVLHVACFNGVLGVKLCMRSRFLMFKQCV